MPIELDVQFRLVDEDPACALESNRTPGSDRRHRRTPGGHASQQRGAVPAQLLMGHQTRAPRGRGTFDARSGASAWKRIISLLSAPSRPRTPTALATNMLSERRMCCPLSHTSATVARPSKWRRSYECGSAVVNRHSVPPVVRVEVSWPIETPHPGCPERRSHRHRPRTRHPLRSKRLEVFRALRAARRRAAASLQAPFNASDPSRPIGAGDTSIPAVFDQPAYLEVSVAIVSSQAVAIASSMGVASSGLRVATARAVLNCSALAVGGNQLAGLCRAREPGFPGGFEPAQVGTRELERGAALA